MRGAGRRLQERKEGWLGLQLHQFSDATFILFHYPTSGMRNAENTNINFSSCNKTVTEENKASGINSVAFQMEKQLHGVSLVLRMKC